jgi:hypothetical protein
MRQSIGNGIRRAVQVFCSGLVLFVMVFNLAVTAHAGRVSDLNLATLRILVFRISGGGGYDAEPRPNCPCAYWGNCYDVWGKNLGTVECYTAAFCAWNYCNCYNGSTGAICICGYHTNYVRCPDGTELRGGGRL